MFKLQAAEMEYDRATSEALRNELIQLRDVALGANQFGNTVLLSHVIAWMFAAMQEMEKNLQPYLIWSFEHEAWWNPNEAGYTKDTDKAGVYDADKAIAICYQANGRGRQLNEIAVPQRLAVSFHGRILGRGETRRVTR